jgi:hypothetical protein
MDRAGSATPFRVSSRRLPARAVREVLEDGGTAVLLSSRDEHLRAAVEALPEQDRRGMAVRLGDGRTALLLCADGLPAPYAYWPRSKPQSVWQWACRACGAVDDRWSWRDIDETAPLVRQAYDIDAGELVDVPWSCPRGSCHGAPMWHAVST